MKNGNYVTQEYEQGIFICHKSKCEEHSIFITKFDNVDKNILLKYFQQLPW